MDTKIRRILQHLRGRVDAEELYHLFFAEAETQCFEHTFEDFKLAVQMLEAEHQQQGLSPRTTARKLRLIMDAFRHAHMAAYHGQRSTYSWINDVMQFFIDTEVKLQEAAA